MADFQAVQTKVARARCLIDSARYFLRQSAMAFQAYAGRNEAPDLQTRLRFRAHSAFAVNQSRFSFNFDIAGAAYGLHAPGGQYTDPTM